MISGKGFLWALSLSCLCSCLPAATQSKATTQELSQNIHATLDELKAQQEVLSSALAEARSDLKLSQGQVRELQTELNALTISSQNMSEKLTGYMKRLNALEQSRSGWRKAAFIGWGLILLFVALKVLKIIKHIPVPFI